MESPAELLPVQRPDPARASEEVFRRFSLKYLVEIVFRRKWVLITCLLLVTVLAVLGGQLISKSYESTTTILVKKEEVLNPLVRWQTAVSLAIEDRLSTFEKIIYSHTLLEQVSGGLELAGPDPEPIAVDHEIGRLRGAIRTEQSVSGSDSFQIQVEWDDPVLAKGIAELVTELFIETSLEGDRKQAGIAVDFIAEQLELYQEQLTQAEDALRTFKEENPEKLPDQHSSYVTELKDYRHQLVEADVKIKELTLKVELLTSRLNGEEPMVIQSALYVQHNPYRAAFQDLNIRYQSMLGRLRPDHPDVVEARAQLEALERIISQEKDGEEAQERQEVRSPVFQEILAKQQDTRLELKAAQLQRQEYQEIAAALEKKVATIPANEMALNALEREVHINKELFDSLRLKVEQARISQQVELQSQANRFQILDPARVPFKHSKPNSKMILIAGLMGGIALGFGLVFLFEFLDPAILREEEIEHVFGDRVLAKIPKLHR